MILPKRTRHTVAYFISIVSFVGIGLVRMTGKPKVILKDGRSKMLSEKSASGKFHRIGSDKRASGNCASV